MGAVLDLIGSYIFKAAMIGIILSTSVSLNEVMVEKSQLAILEKNINVASSVLEWDMRNVGYNTFTNPFTLASWSDLRFNADVQDDGAVDQVRWYLQGRWIYSGSGWIYRYDLIRTVNGTGNTVMARLV